MFSVTHWAAFFCLCETKWNDRLTTQRSTLHQTAFFLVIWRRQAGAGSPLCVFGYQLSAYFVCAVILPIVIHGGGWKTSALTQIHRKTIRDKTKSKAYRKAPNYCFYRCVWHATGEPHTEMSIFICLVKHLSEPGYHLTLWYKVIMVCWLHLHVGELVWEWMSCASLTHYLLPRCPW